MTAVTDYAISALRKSILQVSIEIDSFWDFDSIIAGFRESSTTHDHHVERSELQEGDFVGLIGLEKQASLNGKCGFICWGEKLSKMSATGRRCCKSSSIELLDGRNVHEVLNFRQKLTATCLMGCMSLRCHDFWIYYNRKACQQLTKTGAFKKSKELPERNTRSSLFTIPLEWTYVVEYRSLWMQFHHSKTLPGNQLLE